VLALLANQGARVEKQGIVTETYPDINPYTFTFLPTGEKAEEEFAISKHRPNYNDLVGVVENSRRRTEKISVGYVTKASTQWVQTAKAV
jgi:hypothetical protein